MSYIVVRILSPFIAKTLYRFEKTHPEMFAITMLGKNKKQLYTDTVFFKDNGLVLTYIAGLMEKYPFELEVYGAEKINKAYLPSIVAKGGRWLAQNNHNNFKYVAKNIGVTNEELFQFGLGTKVPVHSIKEEVEEMRKKSKENNKIFSND